MSFWVGLWLGVNRPVAPGWGLGVKITWRELVARDGVIRSSHG